eukprot:TRINITY_DN1550_c0_g1_i2.p2 TRINITY_DN1550_c0_g1~~TRINITY_DN1550_c0_g1_i2.p2  ORF type:complete len:242 (-),score=52.26 TRINITY_DN1550_c0_g1_i2:423-1148(-)
MMELMNRSYKQWNFSNTSFTGLVGSRNVEHLPEYYYKDDGNLIWGAILKFVQGILSIYYTSENDIHSDEELQNFAREVATVGYFDHPNHGFPEVIDSLETLIDVVSTVVWTASVQHSTVNFGQYDTFGNIPFCSASMFSEPPGHNGAKVDKTSFTYDHIINCLPNKEISSQQVAIMYVLSSYSDAEDVYLGDYDEMLFTEHEALACFEQFRDDLRIIEDTINERNDWTKMIPSKIPSSPAI